MSTQLTANPIGILQIYPVTVHLPIPNPGNGTSFKQGFELTGDERKLREALQGTPGVVYHSKYLPQIAQTVIGGATITLRTEAEQKGLRKKLSEQGFNVAENIEPHH